MENFSFEIFNNLFKRDPEKAIAYRDKYRNPEVVAKEQDEEAKRLAEIEESNKTPSTIIETPKEDTIQAEVVENTPEKDFINTLEAETTNIEVTEEEVKEKLTNAGIKFHHKAKLETLIKLAIEHNIL